MHLYIIWVELKMQKQCVWFAFCVACEMEKVVSFTQLALNAFCPNNNNNVFAYLYIFTDIKAGHCDT
jgi:hypothetical protein